MALQAFLCNFLLLLFAARAQAQLSTSKNLKPACSNSYSQGREEETVIRAFFQGKVNGVYVELGALDGIKYSNTMKLASCFGWSGLLIEACLDNYHALERNLIRRPSGITKAVHGAVCPGSPDGSPQFINISRSGGAVAGNPSEMTATQLNRWFKTSDVSEVPVEKVPCMPMDEHLASFKGAPIDEKGIKHIDFLSLDVEGSEYTVLTTMDFSTTQVDVLSIELAREGKSTPACREFLANKGFIECDFLHEISVLISFVFVHKSSGYKCPQRASWGFEGPPSEHFVKLRKKGLRQTGRHGGQ